MNNVTENNIENFYCDKILYFIDKFHTKFGSNPTLIKVPYSWKYLVFVEPKFRDGCSGKVSGLYPFLNTYLDFTNVNCLEASLTLKDTE